MAEYKDFHKLGELLADASQLEYSPAKVALLESAVRMADSLGSTDASMEARLDLIDAATFSGAQEKTLVAFSWVLAAYDKDPELLDEFELLWRYKWVLDNSVKFPEISMQKILELCDDFKKRMVESGYGLNSLYNSLTSTYINVGDLDSAAGFYKKWTETVRDEMSDCIACDVHTKAWALLQLGHRDQAIDVMQPLLQNELTCSNKPQHTYALSLFPLYESGRIENADFFCKHGYQMTAGDHQYLDTNSDHLNYMVLRRDLTTAIKNAERHFPIALRSMIPRDRLVFYSACLNLLNVLINIDKNQATSLRVPKSIECIEKDGSYAADELLQWLDFQVKELCTRFDKRNGNEFVSTKDASMRELLLSN